MVVDIFNTQNKYDIIYADPAWSYYNDMTVNPDCTTVNYLQSKDCRLSEHFRK
jgi:hypothetical protein